MVPIGSLQLLCTEKILTKFLGKNCAARCPACGHGQSPREGFGRGREGQQRVAGCGKHAQNTQG